MAKNTTSKILAFIALFGILAWVLGTWAMVLIEIINDNNQNITTELTQEQIEELLKSYSGSVLSDTGSIDEDSLMMDLGIDDTITWSTWDLLGTWSISNTWELSTSGALFSTGSDVSTGNISE